MIEKKISKSVVTIGCDYRNTRGGISTVIKSYSRIYSPFIFISSSRCKGLLSNIADLIKAFITFTLRCITSKTKIVHIHTASNNSFKRKSYFVRIAKFFKKKVVLHIHGGGFKEYAQNNYKFVHTILHEADAIIALSQYWKEYFEKEFTCNDVTIIPNIVDEPDEVKNVSKEPSIFNILFLGLITEAKGIYDLIEAINENREYLCDKFKLHIGGNGESEKLITKITEYRLEDLIIYHGWIDKEEKASLLAKSDAFILPSYIEGVPISILEAMSYGKPIIATNVGGIPEIVAHNVNGILIEPKSKKEIINSIKYLMENTDIKEAMGKASLSKVEQHLPKSVVASLSSLYKRLS